MGKTSNRAVKKYENNHYKSVEVLLSINDHSTIKQYCRQNGYTMSGYIYEVVIKDMASKGIRLEGTVTRDVDAIVNDVTDGNM